MHVARYPEADPANRLVLEKDNPVWRRPRGHTELMAAASRSLLLGVTEYGIRICFRLVSRDPRE